MTSGKPRIAIVGGTGDLGSGLAYQLAKTGYAVTIGSRTVEKADMTAATLSARLPHATISASDNRAAAAGADVVILTVPYSSHDSTLESIRPHIQGKILVDATVPLVPPKVMRVQLPPGGSVARQAQQVLGDNVRVVSAFQNIAAAHLQSETLNDSLSDVLVCGNDAEARAVVVELAESIGLTAWHAGAIDNSVVPEALTSILIFLNKKYELDGAGIRVVAKNMA
ncbi:MAG: NADPH-dependent F420 reductase [Woeseia sp.]